jgi:hypothetical protein
MRLRNIEVEKCGGHPRGRTAFAAAGRAEKHHRVWQPVLRFARKP